MTAGDHLHAAAFCRGRREGKPGGDLLGAVKAPVSQVLVPADKLGGPRLLDNVGHVVEQDIGSQDLLDHVDQRRVPGEFQRGFQNRVYLAVVMQSIPYLALCIFKLSSKGGGFFRAQDLNPAQKAVFPVLFSLRLRSHRCHRALPDI